METVVINQIKDQSYTMKESLRALKTSISFSGKGVKSILFTSSLPNEGKTTVVMDLARSMADSKKSVLVVDTDMRKSVLVGRIRAKLQIVVDKFACFIKPQLLSAYTKVLRIPACLNQPHDNLLIMVKPLQ